MPGRWNNPAPEVPLRFNKKYKGGDTLQRHPLRFNKKYKGGDTLQRHPLRFNKKYGGGDAVQRQKFKQSNESTTPRPLFTLAAARSAQIAYTALSVIVIAFHNVRNHGIVTQFVQ